jgi:glucose-1-phosphate thymidylyltransferase
MQAVVPAAGEGTRLRPLTVDRPKGLVEVAGKPLLSHALETLVGLGVSGVVVVIGYRGAEIRARYGDSFEDTPLTYVRQDERLGLAHALLQADPHVDGDFLCLNGDNVCRADLGAVVDRHREAGARGTRRQRAT